MPSYFRDKDFQTYLVSLLCRDRNFLKNTGGMLQPKDFRPLRDESDERFIVATLALNFWKRYREPIGGMLRTEVRHFLHQNNSDRETQNALGKLVERITSGEKIVAVQAMEDRVLAYLRDRKMGEVVEELIQARESGTLDDAKFQAITRSGLELIGKTKHTVTDFHDAANLQMRISRRGVERKRKRPLLFIDEFDARSKGPGRGDLGLLLALYKMGKSLGLAYFADSYAKQGLNVLYFTLEDPVEEVEDRMDASLANMPIDRLGAMPNRLRKRFRKFSKAIRGRIKIVDATTDGISVAEIDAEWERQRDSGFVADVVIVDYDDEVTPPDKGVDRRHQFGDIYREYRQMLSRRQCIGWIAAQTQRMSEDTMIVNGSKASEDIGKIRKATVVIGLGQGTSHPDARYWNVAAHKRGRAKFGFEFIAEPSKGLFYSREKTAKLIWSKKKVSGE